MTCTFRNLYMSEHFYIESRLYEIRTMFYRCDEFDLLGMYCAGSEL